MDYVEYGLTLTKGQADKLQRAASNGCPVSIRLTHANLSGDHRILLTRRQAQKIEKLRQSGKGGMTLALSSKAGEAERDEAWWIPSHVGRFGR